MQSNGTNMSTTTSNCSNLRGRYLQTWTDKTKMICTILEVSDKIQYVVFEVVLEAFLLRLLPHAEKWFGD